MSDNNPTSSNHQFSYSFQWYEGRSKNQNQMHVQLLTFDSKQYLFLSFPGKLSETKNFPWARILIPSSAVYDIRSADRTTLRCHATNDVLRNNWGTLSSKATTQTGIMESESIWMQETTHAHKKCTEERRRRAKATGTSRWQAIQQIFQLPACQAYQCKYIILFPRAGNSGSLHLSHFSHWIFLAFCNFLDQATCNGYAVLPENSSKSVECFCSFPQGCLCPDFLCSFGTIHRLVHFILSAGCRNKEINIYDCLIIMQNQISF